MLLQFSLFPFLSPDSRSSILISNLERHLVFNVDRLVLLRRDCGLYTIRVVVPPWTAILAIAMDKEEDQRDVELSTLSAIFPEIQPVNDDDPYTFILEIPVNPSKAVTVFFPAATEQGRAELPAAPQSAETAGPNGNANIDSHELAYLPGVCLRISLPPSYPAEKPPVVSITTSPSWLPTATAQKLENECARLWEELGRDLVVFTYVDHIQQFADDVFGLVSEAGALEISPEHKIAVLDHDIKAKRAAFDKETFDCGICLGTSTYTLPFVSCVFFVCLACVYTP